MNLEELKQYRKKRLAELNQKKELAVNQLQQAVDQYKKQMGASDKEVILNHAKGMAYQLTILIDDFTLKLDIDLRFDSKNDKNKVYAILDNITEFSISGDTSEFGKEINERIVQAIDKDVSKYNRKVKVF